ncbi:hypothetical protein E5K00_20140 [Hymenobacter aquaticus]|uniref:Uncharacterized protein n=1 Tax=Hymenobacter aquaticus TaxID=1867101 RepID=A0A4Z0PRN8_9BACT|nr:hypothetical protein [Hymenobacter aquaticus]TGE20318.1 hypothetical protein E5K00_20140 [Hymenobacter aquaticus]
MLDFYCIADAKPTPRPAELSDLTLAGQLSEADFEHLQQVRIIESRLSYYDDFRWSSSVVKIKMQLLLHQQPELPSTAALATPEHTLFLILLNASAQQAGLVASAE